MSTNQILFYSEEPITDRIITFLTERKWKNENYDSKCIDYFNSRIDFVHDSLLELGLDGTHQALQYLVDEVKCDQDLMSNDLAYTSSFFQSAINALESLQMDLYDIPFPLQSDKLKKLFQFLEKCQNTPDSKSILIIRSRILAKSIEHSISLQLSLKHIKPQTVLETEINDFSSFNLLIVPTSSLDFVKIMTCPVIIQYSHISNRPKIEAAEYVTIVEVNTGVLPERPTSPVALSRPNKRKVLQTADSENFTFVVPNSGITVGPSNSMQLIHHYVEHLPSDTYTIHKPEYKVGPADKFYTCTLVLPPESHVTVINLSQPVRSSKLAKQCVAVEAVKLLYEAGGFDDKLNPVYMNESEEEELGSHIESELKILDFFPPLSNKTCLNLYVVHVGKEVFGILIENQIPDDVSSFSLFINKKEEPVSFQHFMTLELKNTELAYIQNYTWKILDLLFKTEEKRPSLPFYLLPMSALSDEEIDFQEIIIDWDFLKQGIAEPVPIEKVEPSLKDKIVTSTHTPNPLRYQILEIRKDLNVNSPFPDPEKASTFKQYYETKYNISNLNEQNPLLEVKNITSSPKNFLLPVTFIVPKTSTRENVVLPIEVCALFPVPPNIHDIVLYLPSILWRLETLLLAKDLQQEISQYNENLRLSVKQVLSCISAPGCQEDYCYERFEILGDAILKILYSTKLYKKYSGLQEGELSEIRSRITSNISLYKQALSIHLEKYILCNNFDPKKWKPMGFPERQIKRSFSCKTLADSLEALTGAFYVEKGLESVKMFLNKYVHDLESENDQEPMALVETLNSEFTVEEAEKLLGYTFKTKSLLYQALSHPSLRLNTNYERLEFLGDALLDFFIIKHFYFLYEKLGPGQLTDIKQAACSNAALGWLAMKTGLHSLLTHKSNSVLIDILQFQKSFATYVVGDDAVVPPKVLGDIIESTIGAIYVDCDFDLEKSCEIVGRLLKPLLETITPDTVALTPIRAITEKIAQEGCKQYSSKSNRTKGETTYTWEIHNQVVGTASAHNIYKARYAASQKAMEFFKKNPDFFVQNCTCK